MTLKAAQRLAADMMKAGRQEGIVQVHLKETFLMSLVWKKWKGVLKASFRTRSQPCCDSCIGTNGDGPYYAPHPHRRQWRSPLGPTIVKILKFRTPTSLYSLIDLSNRTGKDTLVPPHVLHTFSYCHRFCTIWNFICEQLSIHEFIISESTLKSSINNFILEAQLQGDPVHWETVIDTLNNTGNSYFH